MASAPGSTASVIEHGSKSFASAARLLPYEKRASVQRLYAWCRHCDDEIDGETLGFGTAPFDRRYAGHRLDHLREATLDALAGRAREAPFIALQEVVAQHSIPARYPLDLIEGMAIDVEGRRFANINDTLEYSYHVAGSVGLMMAIILGARECGTLQRACDLGIAFQLTNIARDTISDAQRGRTYLPEDWLREAGVAPTQVADAAKRQAVFDVAARVLRTSDAYYDSALVGIRSLPVRSAWGIASALRIYRRIGEQLTARGCSAWDTRVETSKPTKLLLTGVAAVDVIRGHLQQRSFDRDGLWTPTALGGEPRLSPSD